MKAMKAAQARPDEKERKRAATIACHKDPAYRANYLAKRGVKPVVCLTTGNVFETACCAKRWLEAIGKSVASPGKINDCCKGKSKSAYGYTWAYA